MTSIRRELLVSLLAAVLIAGALAAFAVYHRALGEVDQLLDYQLRQMALAVHDDALDRHARIDVPPFGLDYAIQISSADGVRLHYSRSRVRLPAPTAAGFASIETLEGPWRVYTLRDAGVAVQVGQPAEVRTHLAARAAWSTLMPFILLLPLMSVMVWFAVTRGLKPLERVADAVKARSPELLHPLPEEHVPREIQPVVLALNDLLPRLSRAIEAQREFIADAAHELRTPLSALHLQLQLAERARDDEERRAALDVLREGLGRVTRVVEQLLTLAREEPGTARATREDVELAALARELVAEHTAHAQAKRIDLGLLRADAPAVIRGERDAIRTALSNLLDNALRYTPEAGTIDLSVARHGESVVVEVTDTGPGIPATERERVFDRFYRRAGTDAPGSGLGLAIVRRILERHGAAVELDAGPGGRGLVARVTFPTSPGSHRAAQ